MTTQSTNLHFTYLLSTSKVPFINFSVCVPLNCLPFSIRDHYSHLHIITVWPGSVWHWICNQHLTGLITSRCTAWYWPWASCSHTCPVLWKFWQHGTTEIFSLSPF